ncbi:MAG: IS66 family insertion sequence element accessory protein TnpB [Verrucomicrobia bacterium]|nr:IS66 family insertion sequence element accessory protein TnpB [Verrucomicrobiota bacterium]
MLNSPGAMRIFLHTQDTDMRKSFSSLFGIIRSAMHLDPLSGYLFVFRNKRADRIKCVYYDNDGFAMWYKVLSKGTFQFPDLQNLSSAGLEIDATTLRMILDGIDLGSIRRRLRFRMAQMRDEKSRIALDVPVSLLDKSTEPANHSLDTP